jgi:arylsulfatase A
MNNKIFLPFSFLIAAIVLLCSYGTQKNIKSEKPNILIILADDMGYGELGCYGGIAKTPNLDKLAKSGITFTDFYAGAPNCSPSRAALLTGRAPSIIGMYGHRPFKDHPMHLRDNEVTIAEILKGQGYQTSIFGKWHLSHLSQNPDVKQPQPDDQGFDYYFSTDNNAEPSHYNPANFVRNGNEVGQIDGYSCQIVADEAISWLSNFYENRNPFFMYVAFHEPHASTQKTAPPDLVKNYSQFPEREANCFANVQNLDSAAGRLFNHLVEKNLFENTIIIFASDNGSYRLEANGGLKAVKSYLYEGGIRVPGIFHWKGFNNKPGKVINEAAGLVDLLPTFCDILEIKTSDKISLDGTSILNLIKGEKFNRKKPLFWFFYRTSPEIALRKDNYMIMGKDIDTIPKSHPFSARDMDYIKSMDLNEYELYNLEKDMGQKENLIDEIPNAKSLQRSIDKKLNKIQKEGYYWENLPALEDSRRIVKTEYNKY